jgi:hypothetical protein
LVDADFIIEHPQGIIAARDGVIVYVGGAAEMAQHVRRLRHAMRIDASGCLVLPSKGPLCAGGALDVVIVKEGEPEAVRMEIAAGKIVRWM